MIAAAAAPRIAAAAIAVAGVVASAVGLAIVDRVTREDAGRALEREAGEAAAAIAGRLGGTSDRTAALPEVIMSSQALAGVLVDRDQGIVAAFPADVVEHALLRSWPAPGQRSRPMRIGATTIQAAFSTLRESPSTGVWVLLDRSPVEAARTASLRRATPALAATAAASMLLALLVGGWTGRGVRALEEAVGRAETGSGADPKRRGPPDLRAVAERISAVGLRWEQERLQSTARLGELEAELARRTRDLEQTNRLLLDLANRDALTGLANRRRLELDLDHHLSLARRTGQPVAVIMMDLDHFKAYNDAAGHLVGDSLLRAVASSLRTRARTTDLVVRWGGDEFCVLTPGTDPEGAVAAARGLVEAVREATEALARPMGIEAVGISAGVACFPEDAEHAGALIARADAALFEAKAKGRGTVVRASTG